ncbi:hypothetical protein [Streptomyces goshikiensis]
MEGFEVTLKPILVPQWCRRSYLRIQDAAAARVAVGSVAAVEPQVVPAETAGHGERALTQATPPQWCRRYDLRRQ